VGGLQVSDEIVRVVIEASYSFVEELETLEVVIKVTEVEQT
jgi:hypothetical protein